MIIFTRKKTCLKGILQKKTSMLGNLMTSQSWLVRRRLRHDLNAIPPPRQSLALPPAPTPHLDLSLQTATHGGSRVTFYPPPNQPPATSERGESESPERCG